MAGKKFLNPIVKIALCAVGMVVTGYFLIPEIQSGNFNDRMTIVRAIVFLAFCILLVRSIGDLWGSPDS